MASTMANPTAVKLADNLEEYIIATKNGEEFRLYQYRIAIGVISLPSVLSRKERDKAVRISFSQAQNGADQLQKKVMSGKTVIITKERKKVLRPALGGADRSRSNETVVDDVLAMRPLPEARYLENLSKEIHENGKAIKQLGQRLDDYMANAEVFAKVRIVKALEDDIKDLKSEEARLRVVVDNLTRTAKRN